MDSRPVKLRRHALANPVPLIEEAAGCLCPLLLVLSLLPQSLLPGIAAATFLWLGLGHSLLYYFDRMPVTRAAPLVRGFSALIAGALWPLLLRR
ncbi:MAG: hypothetical protein AB8B93_19795 [Pseudomonadales bacterium]